MRLVFTLMLLFTTSLCLAEPQALTVEDLWGMQRMGEAELSPDGERLVFTVTEYDMEKNSGITQLWIVDSQGQNLKQLTRSGNNHTPRWKPDGSAITFLSDRNETSSIYSLSMQGGEAQPVFKSPVDIDNFIWSPDANHIAFSARVYPQAESLQHSAEMDKENDENKVKAVITDGLLFRHWNHWTEGKRSHVFVCTATGDNIRDLTPGDYDTPPLSLGGGQDFVFSPNGDELVFTRNIDPMVAISTNNDLFVTSIDNGEITKLTTNPANDNQPLFSADGRTIYYRAMERAGFEADQIDLMALDRGTNVATNLTESFDRSVGEVILGEPGETLYFTAQDHGRVKIYRLDLETRAIAEVVSDHVNSNIMYDAQKDRLVFKQQAVNRPYDLYTAHPDGKTIEAVTQLNQERLQNISMNEVEDFTFTSFDGKKAHGFLLKPFFFDATKTYPMIYLIHGGPQGMWSDDFHYRWNASLFAAPGYVVAMVNFRGSKGYGQEWCDAVSKNWGGGPYKDLMTGLDYLTETYDFIDSDRIVAAGASYGGFMINWIATHTDRFKALVCHAGVFDQVSMYGATEELWFPEWEFNGTPYEDPELYKKWSPSTYAENLAKYKTPTLVIHGQHDYRVPVTQGFQMFTALQRQGVPSRLIYFPDEYHFVTKPQNARLWWNEIFSWYKKWLM